MAPRPRVLMVLTREVPATPHSGRERTLRSIVQMLEARHDIHCFELRSLLHEPGTGRLLGGVWRLMTGLLRGQPCPLQTVLFHDSGARDALATRIESLKPDVVYFDGIRTTDLLIATRQRFPSLRLVCDFDDLMSLRFQMLLARRLPISLGYLRRYVPHWMQNFLQRGFVTRYVLGYEARALQRAETLAVQAADAVTVVSEADIAQLRKNVGPVLAPRAFVIPPGVRFPQPGIRTLACSEFVFVGTDSLLQNRLTIEFLLQLWRETRPAAPLNIIGRMTHSWPDTPGVRFKGFVDEIADVYRDDCVALCPSFLEGGIKTKVLEALGQGVVPVGNAQTFEGMGCDSGALSFTDSGIRHFVSDPARYLPELRAAADTLLRCIKARYSFEVVERAWSAVLATAGARQPR